MAKLRCVGPRVVTAVAPPAKLTLRITSLPTRLAVTVQLVSVSSAVCPAPAALAMPLEKPAPAVLPLMVQLVNVAVALPWL